jgi:hypothetical protein
MLYQQWQLPLPLNCCVQSYPNPPSSIVNLSALSIQLPPLSPPGDDFFSETPSSVKTSVLSTLEPHIPTCLVVNVSFVNCCSHHRYRKSLNRLLKVCYVPASSSVLIAFFSSFFDAPINSTNEANKAAGTCC